MSDNASVSRRLGLLLGGSGLIIVAVGLAIVATPKLTSSEEKSSDRPAAPWPTLHRRTAQGAPEYRLTRMISAWTRALLLGN